METEKELQIYNFYKASGLFFDGRCPICRSQLDITGKFVSKSLEEPIYYCSVDKIKISNRYSTIFYNMKITFSQFDTILYYYLQGFTSHQIQLILCPRSPSIKTIKSYTKMLRSLIHIYVQNELLTLVMPGPVEVDEACLYRIRKGQIGRIARTVYRVFGLKCRSTKRVVLYPAADRTRETLITLIQLHIPQGSKIYTNRFLAYWNNRTFPHTSYLEPYGYQHLGINHSQHFVSTIDNTIHTNTIERVWRSIKEKFRNNKPRTNVNRHISEYMFEAWVKPEFRYQFVLSLLAKFQKETH